MPATQVEHAIDEIKARTRGIPGEGVEAVGQNIMITVVVGSSHAAQSATRSIRDALREVDQHLQLTWRGQLEVRD